MKKIILPIIFISCSVIYSNILFVPEEFLTIQQAVVVAQNEDTVSVNFGHPNGQRITVTTSRIFGKDITFEVRGEGKEKLFEMLKVTNNQPNTNSNPLDSGWTEQGLVNRIDSSSDQQPHIAVNNSGQPWVIWMGWVGSSDLAYSKWNGENWDEEMGVINYNGAFRFRPRISFDDQNRAWVVYDRKSLLADTDAIYFTRWNGSGWEPELPVHQADSIRLNFAPKIAFGGGQIWCCWYGNVTDRRYKIYVSRWNGNNWEPKTQISPPDTSHRWHWWCDIAVDSLGLPHVVWSVTGFGNNMFSIGLMMVHNGLHRRL